LPLVAGAMSDEFDVDVFVERERGDPMRTKVTRSEVRSRWLVYISMVVVR
jgi:hypothetical protein